MRNKKKTLLIFTRGGGGRFGNQLMNYAHFISWLKEIDFIFDFINMAFWPYATLLNATFENKICTFPTNHKRFRSILKLFSYFYLKTGKYYRVIGICLDFILHKFAKICPGLTSIIAVPGKEMFLNDPELIKLIKRNRIVFISGWKIRDWQSFYKHTSFIRESLEPNTRYKEDILSLHKRLRESYNYIVGIQIRHGDYRIWHGGEYFYSYSQYMAWIEQVVSVYSQKKVAFLITSDSDIPGGTFNKEYCVIPKFSDDNLNNISDDIFLLSLCDCIMAPPSTFSVFAAYLGSKPLICLESKNYQIDFNKTIKNSIRDAQRHPVLSRAIE